MPLWWNRPVSDCVSVLLCVRMCEWTRLCLMVGCDWVHSVDKYQTCFDSLQEIDVVCRSSDRRRIKYFYLEEKHLQTRRSWLTEIHEHFLLGNGDKCHSVVHCFFWKPFCHFRTDFSLMLHSRHIRQTINTSSQVAKVFVGVKQHRAETISCLSSDGKFTTICII